MKKIICDTHGKRAWKRHVCCDKCERVFSKDEAEKRVKEHENKCVCGVQLMPDKALKGKFSARAICPECYKKRR